MLRTFREDKLFRFAALVNMFGILLALIIGYADHTPPHTRLELKPVKQRTLSVTANKVELYGPTNATWNVYYIITRPDGRAESGTVLTQRNIERGQLFEVFERLDTHERAAERWPDEMTTVYTTTGHISHLGPWLLWATGAVAALTGLWLLRREWARADKEFSATSMPIEKSLRSEN